MVPESLGEWESFKAISARHKLSPTPFLKHHGTSTTNLVKIRVLGQIQDLTVWTTSSGYHCFFPTSQIRIPPIQTRITTSRHRQHS